MIVVRGGRHREHQEHTHHYWTYVDDILVSQANMALLLLRRFSARSCCAGQLSFPAISLSHRSMATVNSGFYKSHVERTAAEPRRPSVHQVELQRVDQVNDNVRLLRLGVSDPRGVEVVTLEQTHIGLSSHTNTSMM